MTTPFYQLRGNIRRYERVLADPKTLPVTREVVVELLANARRDLESQVIAEIERAVVISAPPQ
jgi:hypothetical protein